MGNIVVVAAEYVERIEGVVVAVGNIVGYVEGVVGIVDIDFVGF